MTTEEANIVTMIVIIILSMFSGIKHIIKEGSINDTIVTLKSGIKTSLTKRIIGNPVNLFNIINLATFTPIYIII